MITKPFPTKFDGEPDNCLTFIEHVLERVIKAGWDRTVASILDIPIGTLTAPDLCNVVEEFARVTMEDVRAVAVTYANTQTRAAQNAYHMYETLAQSITAEMYQKIVIDLPLCKINGTGNGPLLFKLIMSECTIDTPSTIIRMREKLMHLDTYMSTVQGDVDKFNKYTRKTVRDLRARGQIVSEDDLLIWVFRGYEVNPDPKLSDYYQRKKDLYDEGVRITVSELMTNMNNKYLTLVEDGTFNQLTETDKKIVALQSLVKKQEQQLKDGNLTLSKQLMGKLRNFKSERAPSTPNRPKRDQFKNGYRVYTGTHKWRGIPPSEGEPNSKEWKGKTYNWCVKHKGWVIHDPKDCKFDVNERIKRERDDGKASNSPKRNKSENTDERVNKIWKALVEESDDEYCQFIEEE